MSSIVIKGNTSGQVEIAAPDVAGSTTLTLPANTGNIVTTGDSGTVTQGMIGSGVTSTGPAFSAYGATSVPNGTWTKITCDTEEFDTNSNYDNVTNYRFTPTVAGYYQVNGLLAFNQVAMNNGIVSIYKNGFIFKRGNRLYGSTNSFVQPNVSALIYLNGSTDYIEMYGYQDSGSTHSTESSGAEKTYFQAYLVRAA